MSTLAEITFSILDTIRPENMTSGNISEEIVQYHIKNIRAQLAKQQIGKYNTLTHQWFQPLGCIALVEADKSECCDFPTGCIILRTEVPVPSVIDSATTLLKVGPVDITSKPFQQVEFERVPFEGTNRFTKSLIKWFINNNTGFVYLLINKDEYLALGIETISMQGVIEDPMEASSFTNCSTGEPCFSVNSRYPIPDSIVPILQEIVMKKFIMIQAQAPVDVTNDGKTNPDTTINKGV